MFLPNFDRQLSDELINEHTHKRRDDVVLHAAV